MSDERRWGDRDRDWRNDRDRNDYGERWRQDERSFGRYGGGERYSENDQGRRMGGRMDYDAGNPGRFGRESWGASQSSGSGDWPNYASDYDYRRDYRGGGSDNANYWRGEGNAREDRDYGRGYGGSRSERDYGGSYGSGAYGYGSGAFGSSYGSGMNYGYGRDERSGLGGNRDYRGDYGRRDQGGSRADDDRNWFDKAGDEVQSWFGDRDAERRRQQDRMREGEHRGRGPTGYRRSDERIREDVNDRLSDDSWLDASNIDVHVHDGEVTLNGTVHDRHDKHHAEDLAERVSGVHHVQNNLRCKTTSHGLATSATSQTQTGAVTTGASASSPAGATTTTTAGSTIAGQPKSKETI
ncbi:MAG: BON domain-containing protein [Caulobacteraceae bacterium]|nr:BON domain-containing protein [Caulobacteraceae bacterium]